MKPQKGKPGSRKSKAAKPDAGRTQPLLQKSVIQHSMDGIVIANEKGSIIEWNPAHERITGLKRDEVLEQKYCDVQFRLAPEELRTPKLRKQLKEGMRRIVEDNDTSWSGHLQEVEIQRADGNRCIIQTTPFHLKTGSGIMTGSIHCDVTERKRMEGELEQRMRELETFVNNIPHMAWLKDPDSNFIIANQAFGNAVGMSQEYLKSHTCAVCFGEKAAKKFKADDRKVIKGKKQITLEETIVAKGGKKIYLETTKSPIFNDTGDVVGTVGIAIDITDRKQAEAELRKYRHQLEELVDERTEELKKELTKRKQAESQREAAYESLRESEEKFKGLVESSSDWIWEVDKNGVYTYVSPKIEEILGYKPEKVVGKTPFDLMPPEETERVAAIFKGHIGRREPIVALENVNLHKDGRRVVLETSGVPILDEAGNIHGYRGVDRDITDRKKVEMKLQKSTEQYKEMSMLLEGTLNGIPDVIGIQDRNHGIMRYNAAGYQFLNMTPKEVHGKKCFELLGKDKVCEICATSLCYESKKPEQIEKYIEKMGIWLDCRSYPLFDKKGNIVKVIEHLRDITKRKRIEEDLRESEQKLRNVFESVSEGIFTMDLNGAYTEVNKKVLDMYGLKSTDEVLGKSGFQFVAPRDIEKAKDGMKKVLEGGAVVLQEFTALRPDGSEFDIEVTGTLLKDESGNPIGIIGIARNITERKRVEEGLRNAERLESLGFLAGGIAHDFNNLLSGIFGNIQIAMMNSSSEEKVLKSLERAIHAMTRAKDLTQQLLTFASGGAPVMKLISIEDALKESVSFALSGSNIQPSFSIDQDIWTVEADQGQIHQVINNILLNARQAMPEGGTIEIKAVNVNVESEQMPSLRDGMYVQIAIKDHGIGMPRDILEKIFDPFFTTKQAGSGLGLSICYSIVKKHNGYITVDSRPGAGSVFIFYLPASEKKIQSEPEKQLEILKGKGRILIMDDESIVCEMLIGELDLLGYEVKATYNGDEAVKAYGEALQSGKKFDAVILDLTIPGGKGGKETISELLNIDADIKAVVSSGYSDNPVIANPEKYGFRDAIQKPFNIEVLSQVLYDLLIDKKNSKD